MHLQVLTQCTHHLQPPVLHTQLPARAAANRLCSDQAGRKLLSLAAWQLGSLAADEPCTER